MSTPETIEEFLEIYDEVRKLAHLSDKDLTDSEVHKHIRLVANIIYFYRMDGVKKVEAAVRDKWLKEAGVLTLKPRKK